MKLNWVFISQKAVTFLLGGYRKERTVLAPSRNIDFFWDLQYISSVVKIITLIGIDFFPGGTIASRSHQHGEFDMSSQAHLLFGAIRDLRAEGGCFHCAQGILR